MAANYIPGTPEADILAGSPGEDLIEALDGNDVVAGGAGDDVLRGGDGDDVLAGEAGADTLIGDRGNDVMLGGDGADTMVWNNGDGSDVMEGGAGRDTALVNGADGAGDLFEIRDSAAGVAFERVNLGPFSLDIRNTERLTVNGLGGDDTVDASGLGAGLVDLRVDGGAGRDVLIGSAGDDALLGGAGRDLLIGGKGNDLMRGGAGADTMVWNNGDGSDVMQGGLGHDTGVVNGADGAGDAFVIAGSAGDVSFARTNLGPFTIDIAGTERLEVNGQGGDDVIDASALEAGAIRLKADGGAGDDILTGGAGDDVLLGGTGNDWLEGEKGNDYMRGGQGRDVMAWDNGDGSDVMDGGLGYDTVLVDGAETAGDHFEIRGTGDGVLFERVNLGNFTLDITNSEKLVVKGLGGDDVIDARWLEAGSISLKASGGAGRDVLTGGAGDDRLDGGQGSDWLTGGAGADTFIYASGHDTITDFQDGEDVIALRLDGYGGWAGVVAAATQYGEDVVIDFGGGDVLTLERTYLGDLDQSDFLF
ncbi:calcium-binding protein [Mangrovicoccus algicola]|uniref:Calcium-binding protein n=1 Tax=Mangrovicoccus algicola TaxID=2771008 RepID=A0A8J6Z9K7_9RHOB|nr:calcium-binding protein [Mangrovicoccus algicola]MBE3638840.1 hypothetical protein [Mangrovicoccus algicola]